MLSEIKKPKGKHGQKLTQKLHTEQVEREKKFLRLTEKLHKKITEREIQLETLRSNLVKKNGERAQLLRQLHNTILANPQTAQTLNKILQDIKKCTKRADRFRRWQQPLSVLTASLNAMGRGPYLPFGLIGQLSSPIAGLAAQFCRLQSLRSNPNIKPSEHRKRILRSTWVTAGTGSIGILGASTVAVMNAFTVTIAAPFLLPIAATAALISNISNTITAFTNYKNAKKRPIETEHGKKIRMKAHFADLMFNISNVLASSGLLGITLATVGVLSLAFPPATLTMVATIALGITIGATVISAASYLRKTACWNKANNLKLYTDFEYACKNGLIDALNPSIEPKQMRNIINPNLRSRFFSLFNRDTPLHLPKPHITLRASSDNPKPEDTIRHFEQVLHMGYIPEFNSTKDKPMLLPRATPHSSLPKIRLTHLIPPDPILALEAIFKQGGIPEIHDKNLQNTILKAYNKTVPRTKAASHFEKVYKLICDKHVPEGLLKNYSANHLTEAIALSSAPNTSFTPLNYLHNYLDKKAPAVDLQETALSANPTQPKPTSSRHTPNNS